MTPRAMVLSAARTARTCSYTSPRFRPEDFAACKKGSRSSSTWSRDRRVGKRRTSKQPKIVLSVRQEGRLRAAFSFLGVAGLLRRCLRFEKTKELLDTSDLQRVTHPLADANQIQAAAVLLMSDISAHQGADPGRVHVGDIGKVQHQSARRIGAHLGLKIEEGSNHDRSVETKNALSFFRAGNIFYDERLLRHRKILAAERSEIVTTMLILPLNPPGTRGVRLRRSVKILIGRRKLWR